MNILVLNPSSKGIKNFNRDTSYGAWCHGRRIGGAQVPPLNLLYVATVLRGLKNVCVTFCDAQADPRLFKKLLSRSGFDIVIFSTSFFSIKEDMNNIKALKQNSPRLKSIVFGNCPTFLPEYTLKQDNIDIIARFEPEFILRELIAIMANNGDWHNVKGIGYRYGKGVKINPLPDHHENLDTLPFPDRSFLSRKANYFIPIIERFPFATMLTSRGCIFSCTFCAAPAFEGNIVRSRSADNIFQELISLKKAGIKEVYFRDENFTFFKERNRSLLRRMIEEDVGLKWICNAHINTIDESDIGLFKESGCHYIKFGIESGSPGILKIIKKDIDLVRARTIFDALRRRGIDTHASFMIGLPQEDDNDFQATIQAAKALNPTTATFAVCTPYPGTALFKTVQDEFMGLLNNGFLKTEDIHLKSLLNERFSKLKSELLGKYVKKAYYSFYARPSYFLRALKNIKGFGGIKKICRAAYNVAASCF